MSYVPTNEVTIAKSRSEVVQTGEEKKEEEAVTRQTFPNATAGDSGGTNSGGTKSGGSGGGVASVDKREGSGGSGDTQQKDASISSHPSFDGNKQVAESGESPDHIRAGEEEEEVPIKTVEVIVGRASSNVLDEMLISKQSTTNELLPTKRGRTHHNIEIDSNPVGCCVPSTGKKRIINSKYLI